MGGWNGGSGTEKQTLMLQEKDDGKLWLQLMINLLLDCFVYKIVENRQWQLHEAKGDANKL